jgi:fatty acid desaturase
MTRLATFILDDYVSPKIITGPHASEASQEAAEALNRDPQYQELMHRLKDAGFFTPSPWRFTWRIAVFALAYLGAFAYLLTGPAVVGHVIACGIIGFAHVHGAFIAHDAGHGAITKNKLAVASIGQFFDTFLGGYSFSYFCRNHDLHHYHCNEFDRDPNTMGALWALNEQASRDKTALTRATTRLQYILIPLLYPLWSFAMRLDGIRYVLRNLRRTKVDAVVLLAHFALWFSLPVLYLGWWGAVASYVGVTVVTGIYLGVIIPVNHVGMATLDSKIARSFIVQQVCTSRNLTSSPLRDFFFIGQNAQIEHHLFPWAPTFNLGRGRKIVRDFCREHGIHYHECSYGKALQEVHQHFVRMAKHTPALPALIECPALDRSDHMLPRAS